MTLFPYTTLFRSDKSHVLQVKEIKFINCLNNLKIYFQAVHALSRELIRPIKWKRNYIFQIDLVLIPSLITTLSYFKSINNLFSLKNQQIYNEELRQIRQIMQFHWPKFIKKNKRKTRVKENKFFLLLSFFPVFFLVHIHIHYVLSDKKNNFI